MKIRNISAHEINTDLFNYFERYQKVEKCYRKIDGVWVIKNISFEEKWDKKDYEFLCNCLINTIDTGGIVCGGFINGKLKGFFSVEEEAFGKNFEYLQLSSLHISYEERGKGYGKILFKAACEAAKIIGCKKLYISAHSSVQTQGFYHALGCKDAEFISEILFEKEPYDRHLEYVL